MTPSVAQPYRYECVDKSPLLAPFCRWIVHWFVIALPMSMPPNLVTLGSSACMWLMLAYVLGASAQGMPVFGAVCAVLMTGYVIYDHADGMQARRTKTSSPLGEFLDHYLDAFHGSITIVAIFAVAADANSAWLCPLVAALALGGAATMSEQRELGRLYFGFPGPLEAMLTGIAVFSVAAIPAIGEGMRGPQGHWLLHACAAVVMIAAVFAAVGCVRRVGRVPIGLAVYALSSAMIVLSTRGAAPTAAALLVMLHSADFTGRTIESHLRATARPWPDLLVPIVLVAGVVVDAAPGQFIAMAGAYLVVRNLWLTGRVVRCFRQVWSWWLSAAAEEIAI